MFDLTLWLNLLTALKMTISVFLVVLTLSIPLGLVVACLRLYGPKWLQYILQGYIYLMRGTPLLLQLMVVFFGLATVLSFQMDRLQAALFAFTINYTAYYAEIFRGGIGAIDKGQFESIKVLGIGKLRGFRRIILPQVWRIVLPAVTNEVLALIKDTSLIYVIGLTEILKIGQAYANKTASLMPYLAVGLIYLFLTGCLTVALHQLEKRVKF